jgi:hypothetical protein
MESFFQSPAMVYVAIARVEPEDLTIVIDSSVRGPA